MRLSQLASRWPDHLVRQIATGNFVLVVGAGLSAGCTNSQGESPPMWDSLLLEVLKSVCDSRTKDYKAAKAALDRGDYLECAEIAKLAAKSRGKSMDFLNAIAHSVDGPSGRHFGPSDVYSQVMRLNPSFIVTTNYDRILERATRNGFKVHSFTSETLGSETRGGSPLLVKIHGSVDDSENLILTRGDYSKVRRNGSHALSVVQAMFLTRPVLFLGYGFRDPDIHLMLENVLGATDAPPTHYLLTGDDIPEHLMYTYRDSYGTAVIKFKSGNYVEMAEMIRALGDLVESEIGASAKL